jgi:hypothetical protein
MEGRFVRSPSIVNGYVAQNLKNRIAQATSEINIGMNGEIPPKTVANFARVVRSLRAVS